ncbi:hypothetical protein QUA82_32430 [Microcoleus sp. F8-D3]
MKELVAVSWRSPTRKKRTQAPDAIVRVDPKILEQSSTSEIQCCKSNLKSKI